MMGEGEVGKNFESYRWFIKPRRIVLVEIENYRCIHVIELNFCH